MIKKTAATKYKVHDAALALQREFWSFKKHAKELYYETGDSDVAPEPQVKSNNAALAPETPPTSINQPANVTTTATVTIDAAPAPSVPVTVSISHGPATVTDKPISPIDIIIALIAHKLKKLPSGIDLRQSIKQLTGGEFRCPHRIPLNFIA